MKLPLDVMVDLETMGVTGRDVAVVSIGAVAFNPFGDEVLEDQAFYKNVSLQSCIDAGLRVDGATVMWWLTRTDQARQSLLAPEPVDLDSALFEFKRWFEGIANTVGVRGFPRIWSHGSTFDVAILEALYGRSRYKSPWFYSSARDTRTIFDAAKIKLESADTRAGGHNALADAVVQARGVQAAHKVLNIAT